MSTKDTAGAYDCYENAEPDEPMFVLLARDDLAPLMIRIWVQLRQRTRPDDEVMQHTEAIACAEAMECWHIKNRL